MASNNWSTALVNYASQDPTIIPPDVYVTHNDHFTTIRDLYPKSSYHLLILPRLPFRFDDGSSLPASPSSLDSLQSFLKLKPEIALEVLDLLEETVGEVEEIVKKQMRDEKGWEWDVVYGFHAVPSMKHLHLHVLSKDLISPCLKNKKHYNSFSPTLGFFLHLSTVREWLENPSKYKKELLLKRDDYEPLLKGPLVSFYSLSSAFTASSLTSTSAPTRTPARHSSSPELSSDDDPTSSSTAAKKGAGKGISSGASRGEEFKTMPALKVHLEEELKKLEKRSKKS